MCSLIKSIHLLNVLTDQVNLLNVLTDQVNLLNVLTLIFCTTNYFNS